MTTDIKTVVSDLNKARKHVAEMLAQRKLNISPPFARNLIMKGNNVTSKKDQKYRIVGGKVYEAVQLTEHQFSGNTNVKEPEIKIQNPDLTKNLVDVMQASKSLNNTFERSGNLNNTLNKTVNLD